MRPQWLCRSTLAPVLIVPVMVVSGCSQVWVDHICMEDEVPAYNVRNGTQFCVKEAAKLEKDVAIVRVGADRHIPAKVNDPDYTAWQEQLRRRFEGASATAS